MSPRRHNVTLQPVTIQIVTEERPPRGNVDRHRGLALGRRGHWKA